MRQPPLWVRIALVPVTEVETIGNPKAMASGSTSPRGRVREVKMNRSPGSSVLVQAAVAV